MRNHNIYCARQENRQLPGSTASRYWFAGRGGKGPGVPSPGTKNQLRPSKDGETMRVDKEESIPDAMKEDQRPTE
jgi:hypothetical protein